MENQKVYIYIDESGDTGLDSQNKEESIMVYAAVIIREENLAKARDVLNSLYKKYFKQEYIKSSRIHNDEKGYALTINTLTELKELEHFVIALVIDKSKIFSEGLSYKPIFVKYFQKILTTSLVHKFEDLDVWFDKTGDEDFNVSLYEYLKKNVGFGVRTLFSCNEYHSAEDSTEEPLLQLADFYAGTIRKYYCGKYDCNRANVIHDSFLRPKLSIDWFPKETISFIATSAYFDSTFDEELLQIGYESAKKYIIENKDDISGCELLKYVMQESQLSPLRPISSKEIKANLRNRGIDIGDPIIKVSELRDKGVVLISPRGEKGYKFPYSQEEFAEFLNRLSDNVVPQLRRGYQLNKIVLEKSIGKYNVLSSSEFGLLMDLCERVMEK